MKIRGSIIVFAALFAFVVSAAWAGPPQPGDPTRANLAPMFPEPNRQCTPACPFSAHNWVVTQRLGADTLEFEILTSNIGGENWFRPPIDRTVGCTGSIQYFRVPKTHEYTLYWFDPDLGAYVQIDQRRKDTICIQDDNRLGHDPKNSCLQESSTVAFPCGCSGRYGAGRGNGVQKGWSDSYFRGLRGQWVFIGAYRGDFFLSAELDPDQELMADDLQEVLDGSGNRVGHEKETTHDDNISYVYFHWDGMGEDPATGECPPLTPCRVVPLDTVQIFYTFDPVCPL